ncbi:helix-turn-helix domain-containing protein [Streptomyces nodosus]|uniref:helix-turn-helix domain-containing protein n=1 Tax=Streptomyces nodosus TaxID=40318 RepID=UPI00382B79DA
MGGGGMVSGAEAAELFGQLLRELKERSGLSYGLLAKRLHMSTSTLHRYCNGEVVPTDYAPVERLARLCKASPEELVELHRRWVLADAVRERRSRTAAVREQRPVEPDAAPGPAQERTAVGAAGGTGEPASEPGGAVEPGSGAGGTAEPGPEPGNTGGAGTESVGAGAPAPTEPARGAGAEGSEERTVPAGPGTGARPGTRRRLRAAVLVPVGALVVLGAAVLAWNPLYGTDGSGAEGPVGATPAVDGRGAGTDGGGTDGATAPAASRSGGETADKATGGDKRTGADRSAGPGTGSPTPGTGRETPRSDPAPAVPLTVNTRPYAWENPCSQHYLIDRTPQWVSSPPPTEQDAPSWVSALGAVSSGEQYVVLTVQGTGSQTVVLEDLKVRVQTSGAPLAWNDYAMGVGCGGGVGTHAFGVDLDAGRPAAVPVAGQRGFPFKVSESDPEVFRVRARTAAHDVRWYLELEWSSGARHGTVRIDDHGKPFRTSGNTGRPGYDYPLGGVEWITRQEG